MTIKKITLSALAAVCVSTALVAAPGTPGQGQITVNGGNNPLTISKELISVQDTDVTLNGIEYTPKAIPAGTMKNPIFKFTFSDPIVYYSPTLGVYEVNASDENQSTLIAANPTLSTANKVLTFNAVTGAEFVTNDRTYYIGNNPNKNSSSADMNITVKKSSTPSNVTASAALYSGDSQDLADSSPAAIVLEAKTEYTASVSNPFDARIDASQEFALFHDRNVDGDTKKADDLQVTVKDLNITYPLAPDSIEFLTTWDTNLTKIDTERFATYSDGGISQQGILYDFNLTSVADAPTDGNLTANYDLNLTTAAVAGTSKIDKTLFTQDVTLVKDGAKIPLLVSNATNNAGKWEVYGYYAQIPEVQSNANKETYMTVVNTTSLAANAYFTILPNSVDADGTVNNAGVNECVVDGGTISANQSHKFTFSNILTLAANACNGFPTSGNFAVEIAVPTTPNGVYSKATQKNTVLNQFKDLPVYNTSEINY